MNELIKCPICKRQTFDYVSYSEECYGIVEQHGYCDSCGYTVEQAYSSVLHGFRDLSKGFRDCNGKYHKKNVKKHKRIRRELLGIKDIEVNPMWVWYV